MNLRGTRLRSNLARQATRLRGLFHKLQRAVEAKDPLVAIIRRQGVVAQGKYIMYFEVTLFGNNPVVLEQFGQVIHRDLEPPPPMRPELERVVEGYRYFIEIRQRFNRIEEARDFWTARGATALWHDE